jgi:hypothetical protein
MARNLPNTTSIKNKVSSSEDETSEVRLRFTSNDEKNSSVSKKKASTRKVVSSSSEDTLVRVTSLKEKKEKEKLYKEFKLLGALGRKFAKVVTGTITMLEFDTYYQEYVEDFQEKLDQLKIKENLAIDRMKLFSLLIRMKTIYEWKDWLRRYIKITPSTITMRPLDPKVKPLLFLLRTDKYFTQGDQKPLWILAVLAAMGSKAPIYIHGEDVRTAPVEIQSLATWFIGINWQDKLRIYDSDNPIIGELIDSPQGYIQVETRHPAEQLFDTRDNIVVDFGDNAQSSNTHRFVSCLLSNYRPEDRHFGSLYLPLRYDWSNASDLRKLRHFRAKYNKIICFAGSQSTPVTGKEILNWLGTDPGWGVVLVGRNWEYEDKIQMVKLKELEEVIYFTSMVYEDLVQEVDFFVSNCGAGSVAAAFAGGCPQQCGAVRAVMGADKDKNNSAITNYKVGPTEIKKDALIINMRDVDAKLDLYKIEAQKVQKQIEEECKHLWKVMPKFFRLLSSDAKFQKQVLKHGIPSKYSLGACSTQLD